MIRSRILLCVALLCFGLGAGASAASPQRAAISKPDPIVAAVARYTAYSVGTGTHVAKIIVTYGKTKWYYATNGRKLFRAQAAEFPMGGQCQGWAVARVNAFDLYGRDLYGSIHVLMQFHNDRWMGRMIGHGFSNMELQHIGIEPKVIDCLRQAGL